MSGPAKNQLCCRGITLKLANVTSNIPIFLRRVLAHVYHGTLTDRTRLEWHRYLKRKRLKSWKTLVGKLEYVEIGILPGIRMQVYLDCALSRKLYCGGFELGEQQFLKGFLRPGDVFVDVGASIGLFTLIAGSRVGKFGHVYAFEPYSKTYRRLLSNVRLNRLSNVSCFQAALSNEAGQSEMTISLDGYDAWSSLALPTRGKSFGAEMVQAVEWTEFAQSNNLAGRVTMMKIDVEGWESRVLAGGHRLLSQTDAPVLQVEFNERASELAGSSLVDLYFQLEHLGYKIYSYDTNANKLVSEPSRSEFANSNLIATKHPEHIASRLENRSQLL